MKGLSVEQQAVLCQVTGLNDWLLSKDDLSIADALTKEIIRLRGMSNRKVYTVDAGDMNLEELGKLLNAKRDSILDGTFEIRPMTISQEELTKDIKEQVAIIYKAFSLHCDHPTFPIHLLVDNDEMCEDSGWTGHVLVSAELGWWYTEDGDRIWTEWDDIIDRIKCEYDEKVAHELTDEQAVAIAKQRAHQVILIKTKAG